MEWRSDYCCGIIGVIVNLCGIWQTELSVGLLILFPVGSICSPKGVGEFGGANGRSKMDLDPWSPTETKRRSLGKAVALRHRGRKLYALAGTSEAGADHNCFWGSMEVARDRPQFII